MVSWAYIAGFLDGDGWITKSQTYSKHLEVKNYAYRVGMTQLDTCEFAMKEIYDFMINSGIRARWNTREQCSKLNSSGKMINITVKHQESVVKFLKLIRRHLIIKRVLADECISYVEDRLLRREKVKEAGEAVLSRQEKRRYWKDDDIDKLKEMRLDGSSNLEIAVQMSRSVASVAHKIKRLGISRWKSDNEFK